MKHTETSISDINNLDLQYSEGYFDAFKLQHDFLCQNNLHYNNSLGF